LPVNLQSALPTVEEIEAELDEPTSEAKAGALAAASGRGSPIPKKPRKAPAKKRPKG